MKSLLAALVLALTASGAVAADASAIEAESAALRLAVDRGQLLYAYDQAAWHATDDVVAQAKRNNAHDQFMRIAGGYIVEGNGQEQTVTFFDRATPPNALYRARMADGGTRLASSEFLAKPDPLSDSQQKLIRERQAVMAAATAQKLTMCASANPNITILPAQGANGGDLGYLMTPQTDMKVWPMGGHYRFEVRDGQAGDAQRFANSCLAIGAPPSLKGKPEMMVVTHLVTDTPTELHVFTALAAKLPILVVSMPTKKYWLVTPAGSSASIRLVDIGSAKR